MLFQARKGLLHSRTALDAAAGGGGGATLTWDSSRKHANMTLSNVDLTTTLGSTTVYASLFANGAGRSTGKYYYELTLTSYNADKDGFGIANGSATTSGYIGQTADSVGWRYVGGPNYGIAMGGSLLNIQTPSTGDIVAIAVDLSTKRMWCRSNNSTNWNNDVIGNQDPANGIGGADFSAINAGPYWPYATQENTPSVYTANFGATSYVVGTGKPSGFNDW